jgi:peptidoglycan-N-acetylglucosamine deacetylase
LVTSSARYSNDFLGMLRSLVICSLGLVALAAVAQTTSVAPDKPAPTPIPPAAAQSQITFNSVHVDGPYIALTFDDGPSEKLTPKLLDILAARHIKATFFVIGQNVAEHPEIVKRALKEGHEIGNHSWSHPNLAKMSDESVRRELKKTDDAITEACATRPTLVRPPYGSITPRQKRWIHEEFGYRIILWDVDPLDWKRPGAKVVTSRIMKETRNGSIVLSHDIHPGTIESVPETLNELEAKGFKFVTVSELISMAKPVTPRPSPSATPLDSPAPPHS